MEELCGCDAQNVGGGGLLIAVSGGADSTALACALAPLAARGRRIVLAHIDHGMRPASELIAERQNVEMAARELGLPLRVRELGRGRVCELAAQESCGPEAAARKLRYAALEDLRAEEGLAWIVLGHNAQDQAETRIARFFQGSGPRGLRGIPAKRGRILRPLLEHSREEIIAWLQKEGRAWTEDPSNARPEFQRNRVRLDLLPAIAAIFPGWEKALAAGGQRAALLESLLDSLAETCPWTEEPDALIAEADRWFNAHPALRLHLLEEAASRLQPGQRTPFRFLSRMALAERPAAGSDICRSEGAGLLIELSAKQVIVRKRLVLSAKKGYFFRVDGPRKGTLPDGRLFSLSLGRDGSKGPALGIIEFPALLRGARPGDRMETASGSRLLSDLFPGMRDAGLENLPLLEDRRGVLCAFGMALGLTNRHAERSWRPEMGGPCLELSFEGSVSADVQQRT